MKEVLMVGIGGGVGAIVRYLMSRNFETHVIYNIPYKIILVNIVGCFFIGVLANILTADKELWKLLLITGFLGGFTTFSSFGLEALSLMLNHNYRGALLYILTSFVGGLVAVGAGIVCAGAYIK